MYIMAFYFCVGLYTNIDLLINLLILHNYKIISLTTKFFLQIIKINIYIHGHCGILPKHSIYRGYPLIITY